MRIRFRHVLVATGIGAIVLTLAFIAAMRFMPDYSRNIPAEARGRFAGRWVLESAPNAGVAAGRKTLAIESHPPHLGSGLSYLVTWDGVAIPARSELRGPVPGKKCGVFLAYEAPQSGVADAPRAGFFVNLFTDGSPDDDVENDFLYVDLGPDDQIPPQGFTYADSCLLYVRAD